MFAAQTRASAASEITVGAAPDGLPVRWSAWCLVIACASGHHGANTVRIV